MTRSDGCGGGIASGGSSGYGGVDGSLAFYISGLYTSRLDLGLATNSEFAFWGRWCGTGIHRFDRCEPRGSRDSICLRRGVAGDCFGDGFSDGCGLDRGGGCVEGRSGAEDVRYLRKSDSLLNRLHNVDGGGRWLRIFGGLTGRRYGFGC